MAGDITLYDSGGAGRSRSYPRFQPPSNQLPQPGPPPDVDLNELASILWRRFWSIAFGFVSVVAAVVPGLCHVDPNMSFADAIALAGGVISNRRLTDIEVYRGGDRIATSIDLGAARVGQMQSGDQIRVPERRWLSRNEVFLLGALISATTIIVSQAPIW